MELYVLHFLNSNGICDFSGKSFSRVYFIVSSYFKSNAIVIHKTCSRDVSTSVPLPSRTPVSFDTTPNTSMWSSVSHSSVKNSLTNLQFVEFRRVFEMSVNTNHIRIDRDAAIAFSLFFFLYRSVLKLHVLCYIVIHTGTVHWIRLTRCRTATVISYDS